jgi:peptide/nickel transport system substrate-binding protein
MIGMDRGVIGLLALLVGGTAVLASCAPTSETSNQPVARTARTLRTSDQYEPVTGVATFAAWGISEARAGQIAWMFHSGLTAYDAQGNLQGRLAHKIPSIQDGDWKVNPDGTMEVTWKIRPGVKWHDGTPLTAGDFAFGVQVARDPDLPLPHTGGVDLIRDAAAPDAETLIIYWSQPYFGANTAKLQDLPAVPRHLVQDLYVQGDKQAFANSPYWTSQFVGLGPYRLSQWVQGSFTEGVAFDDYFLGRPKIDRVVIRYFNDRTVMVANLLSGDLDLVPSGLGPEEVHTIRTAWPSEESGTTYVTVGNINAAQLQWRDRAALWVGDLRVRQTLMHLLDRQTLADTFDPEGFPPADLYVAPDDPIYRLAEQRGYTRYPLNPARAMALLTDAGWTRGADGSLRDRSGQPFRIEVRINSSGANVALALADQLKQGGMDAPTTLIPNNATDRMKQRATSQGVFVQTYNVVEDQMNPFTTAEIRGEETSWFGNNLSGYSNPEVDQLYLQYTKELDPANRQSIYADFMRRTANEALSLPLYYTSSSASAFRWGVTGPTHVPAIQPVTTWNIHEWDVD